MCVAFTIEIIYYEENSKKNMEKKKCTKCSEVKPLSEFNRRLASKDGLQTICRQCKLKYHKKYKKANKDKFKGYDKKYVRSAAGKKASRRAYIKRFYSLTLDEHKQMYIDQNGQCAICKIPVSYNKICTDHNHKTNKVRGLLCCRCNIWVAAVDDKGFSKQAVKYVNFYNTISNK